MALNSMDLIEFNGSANSSVNVYCMNPCSWGLNEISRVRTDFGRSSLARVSGL